MELSDKNATKTHAKSVPFWQFVLIRYFDKNKTENSNNKICLGRRLRCCLIQCSQPC